MKIELIPPSAKLLTSRDCVGEMVRLAELAGRCSHQSPAGEDTALPFLCRVKAMGHLSVLRHINLTVRFVTDRTASHQIVRHSHISWTQESQRYVKYGDKHAFRFVCPVNEKMRRWMDDEGMPGLLDDACETYVTLCACGMPAEEARKVLPGCMATTLYGTGNAEAWGHFFKMRCDKHAQADVRALADSLLEQFKKVLPGIYDDLSQF